MPSFARSPCSEILNDFLIEQASNRLGKLQIGWAKLHRTQGTAVRCGHAKMPNCDFYALPADCVRVLDFIFEQPGWVLHELDSENDSPIRTFSSTQALLATYSLCKRDLHFQLYSAEMRGSVRHRKTTFKPSAVPGARFRYSTEGWGLIQLYLGVLGKDGALTACHTNHNSLTRARKWAPTVTGQGAVDAWDWPAVTRTSGRLVRFIKTLAPSKQFLRPVLPAAHAAQAAGRVICVQ